MLDSACSTLPGDLSSTFPPLAVSDQPCSAKPRGASAGARHEWGTTTSLLPITSPEMAIDPSPTNFLQLLLSYYYQTQFLMPQLVKDDVFLAPAAIADNESVTTIDSNNLSDGNGWAPTPCLSPVTSPSDFLCDHEPLFDGIEDLQQHHNQNQNQNSLLHNHQHSQNHSHSHSHSHTAQAQHSSMPMDDGVHRTIFERLTQAGIDWCRYCGTTEGVNWRPGPWGKRTLCNKHGCDYKGYGIASRLPRLDLSQYMNERLEDRRRPVVQQQCVICKSSDFTSENMLVPCEGGCSRAYHQLCRIPAITLAAYQDQQWCCSTVCRENRKRNKVGPYEV
ncbi:hypothetical protein BX666DRAFT_1861302 [Dichotomocladium elegans]|nr:hypothetical protein BX666DRAFT_1861302 [Dichotomocladium elegans]